MGNEPSVSLAGGREITTVLLDGDEDQHESVRLIDLAIMYCVFG